MVVIPTVAHREAHPIPNGSYLQKIMVRHDLELTVRQPRPCPLTPHCDLITTVHHSCELPGARLPAQSGTCSVITLNPIIPAREHTSDTESGERGVDEGEFT